MELHYAVVHRKGENVGGLPVTESSHTLAEERCGARVARLVRDRMNGSACRG